jgi:hypothetical protein
METGMMPQRRWRPGPIRQKMPARDMPTLPTRIIQFMYCMMPMPKAAQNPRR